MSSTADRHPGDRPSEPLRTITIRDRDIKAAAQLLYAIAGLESDRAGEMLTLVRSNVETSPSRDRQILVDRAQQTYVNRARRAQIFNSFMFGEAAWDMLLALYVTEQSEARHTVSGLTELAGVPPTTALRWLDFLEKEQLVIRIPLWTDRRVTQIELTAEARKSLDAYFSGSRWE